MSTIRVMKYLLINVEDRQSNENKSKFFVQTNQSQVLFDPIWVLIVVIVRQFFDNDA
jgi:hypothetical protein